MAVTWPIRILAGIDAGSPSTPARIANWTEFVAAVAAEVATTGGTDIAQVAYVAKSGDDSAAEIGNAGMPFLTIQAAIDAIADASSSKYYRVQIGPGEYAEGLVLKPFIEIWGAGFNATKIICTGSETVSLPADGLYSFQWLTLSSVASATNSSLIVSSAASASLFVRWCDLTTTYSGASTIKLVEGTYDNLFIVWSAFIYNNFSIGSSPTVDMLTATVNSLVFVGINNQVVSLQAGGDITVVADNTSTLLTMSNTTSFVVLPAGYASNARFIDGRGTAPRVISNTQILLSGSGFGSAHALYTDSSGAGADLRFFGSSISVSGFASNKATYIGAADSTTLMFSEILAADTNPFDGAKDPAAAYARSDVFRVNTDIIDENLFLSGSTNQSLQDFFDITASAGWVSGGGLTNNGDGSVGVATGAGFIRTSDSEQAPLKMFDFPATTPISLTNNAWNYVVVRYNAGAPDVVAQASAPNENSIFELYEIYRSGTALQVEQHYHRAINAAGKIQRWLYSVFGLNLSVGGAVLSETGTRNVALSAGARLWVKLNDVLTSAFDTFSLGDTFRRYYSDGGGGWTEQAGQTQFDNVQYDDLSGVLAGIGVNRYSQQDFYMLGDESVVSFYGTSNDVQLADAIAAPQRMGRPAWADDEHSAYLGRIIVRQGVATAVVILQRGD